MPCYPRGCAPRRSLDPIAPHWHGIQRQCETNIGTFGGHSAITFFRNCSHRLFSITYDFAPVGPLARSPGGPVIAGERVSRGRRSSPGRASFVRLPWCNAGSLMARRPAGVSVLTHGWNAGDLPGRCVELTAWPGVRCAARLVRRRPSRGAACIRRDILAGQVITWWFFHSYLSNSGVYLIASVQGKEHY